MFYYNVPTTCTLKGTFGTAQEVIIGFCRLQGRPVGIMTKVYRILAANGAANLMSTRFFELAKLFTFFCLLSHL